MYQEEYQDSWNLIDVNPLKTSDDFFQEKRGRGFDIHALENKCDSSWNRPSAATRPIHSWSNLLLEDRFCKPFPHRQREIETVDPSYPPMYAPSCLCRVACKPVFVALPWPMYAESLLCGFEPTSAWIQNLNFSSVRSSQTWRIIEGKGRILASWNVPRIPVRAVVAQELSNFIRMD